MNETAEARLSTPEPTVTLQLSLPAAYWLKSLTQNYIPAPGIVLPSLDDEEPRERELRHAVFDALRSCLEELVP
jgi:hypothetical protein